MHGDAYSSVPVHGEPQAEAAQDRLVSMAEAQRRLADVSRKQVEYLIKTGELRGKKIGRRVGIYESSIAAYIESLPEAEYA